MDQQDRRVRRTQHLLAQALIDLTLERGYEAVTIRDITERADIGYATFFRHYHDKDALLHDVLEVVLERLMSLLQPPGPQSDPAAIGALLFHYVREHLAVCRVLLGSPGSAALLRQMIATGTRGVLEGNTPRPESPIPAEVAAHHLVASSIALVQWWLDHDLPYPPERMGAIYAELIVRPTHALAFQSRENPA